MVHRASFSARWKNKKKLRIQTQKSTKWNVNILNSNVLHSVQEFPYWKSLSKSSAIKRFKMLKHYTLHVTHVLMHFSIDLNKSLYPHQSSVTHKYTKKLYRPRFLPFSLFFFFAALAEFTFEHKKTRKQQQHLGCLHSDWNLLLLFCFVFSRPAPGRKVLERYDRNSIRKHYYVLFIFNFVQIQWGNRNQVNSWSTLNKGRRKGI